MRPTDTIVELAGRVQARLNRLFDQVGEPEPGSALGQRGLRDGQGIVEDYVLHGEAGLAVEHLLHMVVESELRLAGNDHASLTAVCRAFGIATDGLLPAAADDA